MVLMTSGYSKSETSVHFIGYHFIFCPKYRRSVLVNDVAQRLERLIHQKAKDESCNILALEIMPDHVHLFIEAPPTISPNSLVGRIKGFTSRALRSEFKHLRSKIPALWTRSYFVSTHGHISDSLIRRYIQEQKRS